MTGLTIGISGGGVGGLAAAIALRQAGHDVEIFEQSSSFQRVGADVNRDAECRPRPERPRRRAGNA